MEDTVLAPRRTLMGGFSSENLPIEEDLPPADNELAQAEVSQNGVTKTADKEDDCRSITKETTVELSNSLSFLRQALSRSKEEPPKLNLSSLTPEEDATFSQLKKKSPSLFQSSREGGVELEQIPMLRDLPPEALAELETRMIRKELNSGETIVQQGDFGNAFFVLLSGRVRVEKKLKREGDVSLATLGPGAFFGEFALLSDRKRHASVITEAPSEILEISRKVVGRLAKKYQRVAKTLRRFYRRRLMDTVMHSTPFFHPLSPTERRRLMGHLQFRRYIPGEPIIKEGAKGGGFYLILIGEVQVRKETKAGTRELARMGEGSYFGEMSLLKRRPAVATVVASSHTELVQLDAEDFYRILADYPQIWEEVNREARRRELANHALLTGKAKTINTTGGGVVI